MGLSVWRGEAPSNIALIKYMGKAEKAGNLPANPSLSYTLDHLFSTVEIIPHEGGEDLWEPLPGEYPVELGDKGRRRFLEHFAFIKDALRIAGNYRVRSGNNFPSDCGLASSASSFAALTRAAHALALERGRDRASLEAMSEGDLSALSQRGSGSSSRSFFRPWALWRNQGAEPVNPPFEFLHHQAVLVEKGKKGVSSSEAHRRVASSRLYAGRAKRAEGRLAELLDALNGRDWERCFQLVWAEFWDMHALFETSRPPFGYMNADAMAVLELAREVWNEAGDGPLVTMDAGANVHLLYRPDQTALAARLRESTERIAPVLASPELTRELPPEGSK
jgi:diphosphomevalonate decarboxylase